MNAILQTPLELRYAMLAVLGAWIGGQLNRGIYRIAYQRRSISPWSAPPEKAAARSWWDCLPIIGWFSLRRETSIHGRGFWIRPLLIELACTIAFPVLYGWELSGGPLPSVPEALAAAGPVMLHGQFLNHVVLLCLMIMATFIDFDERTIPDLITIPGTLLALLLAATWPTSKLPAIIFRPPPPSLGNLLLTSPLQWSEKLNSSFGLQIAVLCFFLWVIALLGYTWTTRHGLKKAFAYAWASLLRQKIQWITAGVTCLYGAILIGTTWSVGGTHWQSLLSSLVGMAGGGSLVWVVRIIASTTLKKEAMGFGDVTLLAMIGAFLGWQPAVMIFFLAPVLGLLISVVQAIVTRSPEFAFGPYLCAATVVMVVWWDTIWGDWGIGVFSLGWVIPLVLFVCITIMGAMLLVWRLFKELVLGWR